MSRCLSLCDVNNSHWWSLCRSTFIIHYLLTSISIKRNLLSSIILLQVLWENKVKCWFSPIAPFIYLISEYSWFSSMLQRSQELFICCCLFILKKLFFIMVSSWIIECLVFNPSLILFLLVLGLYYLWATDKRLLQLPFESIKGQKSLIAYLHSKLDYQY